VPSTPIPPPAEGVEVRRLNLRIKYAQGAEPTVDEMLDLFGSTKTATVGGWTVHTQRRGSGGTVALCIRVDSPTGQVLFIATNGSSSAMTSQGPTSTFFGGDVGLIFKAKRTREQGALALASLASAFETAWNLSSAPMAGARQVLWARDLIQGASAGMTERDVIEWVSVPAFRDAISQRRLSMTDLARAHAHGWTPTEAGRFYTHGQDLGGLSSARLASDRTFADAGWSRHDLLRLIGAITDRDFRRDPVPTGWARYGVADAVAAADAGLPLRFVHATLGSGLSMQDAVLAHQAGLSAGEVTRLMRQGRFDRDAVAMLAALRRDATQDSLGSLLVRI
jgi:hypothetical protein